MSRGDLDFIETCYRRDVGDGDWGTALAEALALLVPEALGVMAAPYRVTAEGGRYLSLSGDRRYLELEAGPASSRAYMAELNRAARPLHYLREVFAREQPAFVPLSQLSPSHQRILRRHLPWRDPQMFGLVGTLDGAHGVALAAGGEEHVSVSRRRQANLTRLCEHLAVGYWLRRLSERATPTVEEHAEAVFSADGKLLHRRSSVSAQEVGVLVDAVRNMDRARCRRQKRSPDEAMQLWQALVAGELTLVEQLERNGRRVVLAVRCRGPHQALTEREAAVVRYAAQGLGNKQIAAQLGIATSTAGVHVSAALRKLHLRGRRSLAAWR